MMAAFRLATFACLWFVPRRNTTGYRRPAREKAPAPEPRRQVGQGQLPFEWLRVHKRSAKNGNGQQQAEENLDSESPYPQLLEQFEQVPVVMLLLGLVAPGLSSTGFLGSLGSRCSICPHLDLSAH